MKQVLFDENMPRKLRRDLPELHIRTAREEGWSALENGALLTRASEAFDVLVTIDQRMRYQQNMPRFAIGVVVIEVPDTRFVRLRALVPEIRHAIHVDRSGMHESPSRSGIALRALAAGQARRSGRLRGRVPGSAPVSPGRARGSGCVARLRARRPRMRRDARNGDAAAPVAIANRARGPGGRGRGR